MTTDTCDALARGLATGYSRRGSLRAVGGFGLGTLVGAVKPAAAKKHKKGDKKCKKQGTQCNAFFAPLCEDEDAPEDCAQRIGACCGSLKKCHADAFLECLFAILNRPAE